MPRVLLLKVGDKITHSRYGNGVVVHLGFNVTNDKVVYGIKFHRPRVHFHNCERHCPDKMGWYLSEEEVKQEILDIEPRKKLREEDLIL